jgi:uncharacterized protein YbjT (DUF2867 family)
MSGQTIVVAGAAGNLGTRIVKAAKARGASVVALVRQGSAAQKTAPLEAQGAKVVPVDLTKVDEVARACEGASCVVSALLGLRPVMVDAQTVLVDGAIKAGVRRFIPSDYALDFSALKPGENRNLDLHREFQQALAARSIEATSVLNGAFMELLVGQAPYILFKRDRVLFWQNADQVLDFTTMDDVAAFTAAASMDPNTPKVLKVVGTRITPRQLAAMMSELTGRPFKLTWVGNVFTLGLTIRLMRALMPATDEPFPIWQGMQYSHNMFSGRTNLTDPLDNDRYPDVKWTSVREVLVAHLKTL